MPEQVTIGVLPLHVDGFCNVENIGELWQGADHRGDDRRIPGAAGVIAYPRRADVTVRVLELTIMGFNDSAGAAHPNPRIGVEQNIDTIRTVGEPIGIGDGTRTVTLELPTGATRSADCHVGPLKLGAGVGPNAIRATLPISIPTGALV